MDGANFSHATFAEANFWFAVFGGRVSFNRAFEATEDIQFEEATFSKCEFEADVMFAGENETNRAFADGNVSFVDASLAQDASLKFRYADLSQCRFFRTDIRNAEFTGVKWCEEVSSDGWLFEERFRRVGLYDEVYYDEVERAQEENSEEDETNEKEDTKSGAPWSEIERLYRQLKLNYEDRGDFPKAGDFHIGQKVARRQNPQTHWGARFLLTAYRALSKYGERALPATLWLTGLVPGYALLYYILGASIPVVDGALSYPNALVSSLEATFYPVRSVDFESFWPQLFSIVQRVISPILLALLALALRQRVKR